MSAAANNTFFPSALFFAASFPMLVVFPTPFTPITSITSFLLTNVSSFSLSFSVIISRITSFNAGLTSSTSLIFSFLILSFNLSIISTVVSMPISAIINISSNSSYRSSSIVIASFNVSLILSVKTFFVLVNPFFKLLNNFPNIIILLLFI